MAALTFAAAALTLVLLWPGRSTEPSAGGAEAPLFLLTVDRDAETVANEVANATRIENLAALMALYGADAPAIRDAINERNRQADALTTDIAGATRIESLDALMGVDGPAVLLVDSSAVPRLKEDQLRPLIDRGYAVFGLNIPLPELSALTGFIEAITEINPEFGKAQPEPASFSGSYFSYVWMSPPSASTQQWGRGQNEFRAGTFSAVLRQKRLHAAGLALDENGNVVPLEHQ